MIETEEQVAEFVRDINNQRDKGKLVEQTEVAGKKNKNKKYVKVSSQLTSSQLESRSSANKLVIGVDCEGIQRGRPLSLIQVSHSISNFLNRSALGRDVTFLIY